VRHDSLVEDADSILAVAAGPEPTPVVAGRFWNRENDDRDLEMFHALEAEGLRIIETGQAEALAGREWPRAQVGEAISNFQLIAQKLQLTLETIEVLREPNNLVLAYGPGFSAESKH
jgi:hypothetical protein